MSYSLEKLCRDKGAYELVIRQRGIDAPIAYVNVCPNGVISVNSPKHELVLIDFRDPAYAHAKIGEIHVVLPPMEIGSRQFPIWPEVIFREFSSNEDIQCFRFQDQHSGNLICDFAVHACCLLELGFGYAPKRPQIAVECIGDPDEMQVIVDTLEIRVPVRGNVAVKKRRLAK
jgi:hypothetical protein